MLSAIALNRDDGILAAHIDDVITQTSATLIEDIIDMQIRDGLAYGAYLKIEKHRILLEVCATDAAASALQSLFHTKYAICVPRSQPYLDSPRQHCRSGVQGRRPSALWGHHFGNPCVLISWVHQCIRPSGDLEDFHGVAIVRSRIYIFPDQSQIKSSTCSLAFLAVWYLHTYTSHLYNTCQFLWSGSTHPCTCSSLTV